LLPSQTVSATFFRAGFLAAAYMMRQPQVFLGAILFAITTIHSFIIDQK
jgi:hypothetical protein